MTLPACQPSFPGSALIRGVLTAAVALLLSAGLCMACAAPQAPPESETGLPVVTSVAPLTDIVAQIGGSHVNVTGMVPPGVNSHTFEPTPTDAVRIGRGRLIFLNGLQLEALILDLVQSNRQPEAALVLLADRTLTETEWIYDFSYPAGEGPPNPHLWMDPNLVAEYARIIAAELAAADPSNAATFQSRAEAYTDLLTQLDAALRAAVATIPQEDRLLLTYHDSWAYFARRYGFTVIGAVQPADMSEPSAREVAEFITQIRELQVKAVFGAREFPSATLQAIARETGAELEGSLSDDVLPGEPGAAEHTYIGMIKRNAAIIVTALGGDASPLDTVPYGL